jgi:hypothetical protein
MAPSIAATRVLRPDRRGGSSPVVVETAAGRYLAKLRGAAQGTSSLVAEVIVGALADHMGLPVPERRVVTMDADTPTDDRNDELADLLAASVGENLGFRFLESARTVGSDDIARMDPDFASQVRWLDWLTLNPDRRVVNPNILVDGRRFWLIDHGASLPFQHDWASVTEDTPLRAEYNAPHALDAVATRVAEWDPILTGSFPRESLAAAVAQVPESFLRPMLPADATADTIQRRRAAYVAILWKRLQGPRPFVTTEST